MEEYDVRRLALILAEQAEIEGMKAENAQRKIQGESMAYLEKDFEHKAETLKTLSYTNNEQQFVY